MAEERVDKQTIKIRDMYHGHQQVPTLTMTFTCMFKIYKKKSNLPRENVLKQFFKTLDRN